MEIKCRCRLQYSQLVFQLYFALLAASFGMTRGTE